MKLHSRYYLSFVLLGTLLSHWGDVRQVAVAAPAQAQVAVSATGTKVDELIIQARQAARDKRVEEWRALLDEALTAANAGNDKPAQASVQREFGDYHKANGAFSTAQTSYLEAAAIAREAGDKQAEASLLVEGGLMAIESTQFAPALEVLQKSLELQKPVVDKQLYARAMFGMGQAYLSTSQKELSRVWYEKALALQREIGDKPGQGYTLVGMGLSWSGTEQAKKALTYYQEARELFRSSGDAAGEAKAAIFIGSYYWLDESFAEAIKHTQEALKLYESVNNEIGQSIAWNNFGAIYWNMGEMEESRTCLQKSLEIRRGRMTGISGEYSAIINLGFVENSLGKYESAIERFRAAMKIAEDYRQSLGGMTEAKMASRDKNTASYDMLITLLAHTGKTEELFDVVQKVKARTLIDLMANGNLNFTNRISPQEKERESQLKQKISGYNQQLIALSNSEFYSEKRNLEIQQSLKEVQQQLQFFTDELAIKYPDVSRQRIAQLATLQDIAAFLPADTAILEYVAKPSLTNIDVREHLLLCLTNVAGKAVVKAYPIKANSKELMDQATEFREMCSVPFLEVDEEAQKLYKILLAPAANQIKGKKRLVVCPNGPLWSVPFHALMFKEGQKSKYLVDDFEIAYSYSATTAWMTAQKERNSPGNATLKKLLVMANPEFNAPTPAPKAKPRSKTAQPTKKAQKKPASSAGKTSRKAGNSNAIYDGVEPLPGTKWEADALKTLFPDAVVMMGNQAQEGALKQQIDNYRNLHLATHGYFNNDSPMMSAIIMARPQNGSPEDGLLTAREIFSLRLPIDMIVLSACETGRGQQTFTEGAIGLTWAIFAAGASTQVVSQWAVDDSSTATLMKTFYTNLRQGQPKGAALRSAMLSMKATKLNHPFYWAPFILIGDWSKADLS